MHLDYRQHDHELGMWIDYELLRKQRNGNSQTIIHDPITATNNRYLELADLALGTETLEKRKSKVLQAPGSICLDRFGSWPATEVMREVRRRGTTCEIAELPPR